jgi:putative Mg2+ transporter-C (MgtC) family protein
VSAGLGREATAVFSTLLALVILGVMPRIVKLIDKDKEPL